MDRPVITLALRNTTKTLRLVNAKRATQHVLTVLGQTQTNAPLAQEPFLFIKANVLLAQVLIILLQISAILVIQPA